MIAIIRREIKNYFKRPLFWIGVLLVIYGVVSDTSPYLHTRYHAEGEKIANDKPANSDEGEVYGAVPQTGSRRTLAPHPACGHLPPRGKAPRRAAFPRRGRLLRMIKRGSPN